MTPQERAKTRRALAERMAIERQEEQRKGGRPRKAYDAAIAAQVEQKKARAAKRQQETFEKTCMMCGEPFRTRLEWARCCSYVCAGQVPKRPDRVKALPMLKLAHPEPCSTSVGITSRRYLCVGYEACLAHAVGQNWPSFSCARCQVKAPRKAGEYNG